MRQQMQMKQFKHCPLLNTPCKGQECEWFNERCNACVIQLLAYNTFLVNKNAESFLSNNRRFR